MRSSLELQCGQELIYLAFKFGTVVRDQSHAPQTLNKGYDDRRHGLGIEVLRKNALLLLSVKAGGHLGGPSCGLLPHIGSQFSLR